MTGALKKISKGMPALAGEARALSMALAVKMAGAWVGGAEEVENAGNIMVKGGRADAIR